ncbi:TonB-dependent receptor domain-containing protein [Bradyrhizobium sp. LHD-71]|uniref:TonB-dependent receptor family protein n=1 Tax=Bradyrhizobium sp. LHD-71 TaxID=3072141 RepID=UPI00280DEA0E|nr:TonB-dependent receptor [Bradyrhizobium sp. LHD-71]MDQ8730218.1 TonB-dependent receptor [Bradyrhizobium sp. LHD-71]
MSRSFTSALGQHAAAIEPVGRRAWKLRNSSSRAWRSVLLSSAAIIAIGGPAYGQSVPPNAGDQNAVLLETITVTAPGQTAAAPAGAASEVFNPPTFQSQQRRFMRRPGAETVVSVTERDPGKLTSLGDVFEKTPGVFVSEGGNFISMRGSDIATDGSRSGRGIRAYLDGFPLGRTEAGFTNPLIDLLATDYVEVYRGGNSLRYGAIATGGALNFVSKTGRTAPGSGVSLFGGSFGTFQSQVENGGVKGPFDWYAQGNFFSTDSFRQHTGEDNYRFSGNVGWRPAPNIETRTFFAAGKAKRDLAEPIPLDQLDEIRRIAPANSYLFNERLDFAYQRLANRTVIRDGDTTYEAGAYFLNTALDHLPSPFAGIIDYGWREGGLSGRIEHKTSLAGLPTELVGGVRLGYTAGDFDRYQHRNAGTDKGRQTYDWAFSSWLVESYGESAIEVLPRVRLFTGLQGVFTTRTLDDEYRGGAVAAVGPTASGGPQPGRIAGLLEYERDFQALNPKIGVNWEYARDHFIFANVTRSYEVPGGADLSNVLETQGRTGRVLPAVEAQSAWTWETGLRGGWERFKYDVTFYHMKLRNEILTRCATEISPACTTTIAFNAGRTVHNGVELGLKTVPFVDVVRPGDRIFANVVWNYTDFRFDDDPRFGDQQMPVIPRHQLFGELGYQDASGFYASVNVRHQGDRRATFDGSGGNAFVVPAYTLLGAKVGWHAPDGVWSVFVEGRNLTDVAYVSEFAATPTVPLTQQGPRLVASTSPQVRPGDGRAVYAGMSVRF